MSRRERPGSAPVGAQDEPSKLLEEVRSLRQQRVLAILGAVGATIAFLVSNAHQVSEILYRQPRVMVTTDDDFLQRNGQLTIARGDEGKQLVVSDGFSESPRWFTIGPGAYALTVLAAGELVYRKEFTVERGERRAFVVPGAQGATIRIAVEDRSGHVGPGSQLAFGVSASGNGYLWVFDKTAEGYALVYPDECEDACGNDISVAQQFRLPDRRLRTVIAGDRSGDETLLFLVTSSSTTGSAKRLASQLAGGAITKASGGVALNNWGFTEVTYRVAAH